MLYYARFGGHIRITQKDRGNSQVGSCQVGTLTLIELLHKAAKNGLCQANAGEAPDHKQKFFLGLIGLSQRERITGIAGSCANTIRQLF